MSIKNTLTAAVRADVGKGASRRLRHSGLVPAVVYGAGQEPASLTVEHRELMHATQTESFFSSIIKLNVEGQGEQQVVVRDLQRHPYKLQIMHADFLRVSATEKLRIDLPLHFLGEAVSPAGKASGVIIEHLLTEVEVLALPADLPEYLEVDLSALEPGGSVHLADIKLPAGVDIPQLHDKDDPNPMIAHAVHVSEVVEEAPVASAEVAAVPAGKEPPTAS